MIQSLTNFSESELEPEGSAIALKNKLQQQLRLLEGDHRAYREEAERIISRQERELNLYVSEQEDLETKLALVTSPQNLLKDNRNSAEIKYLLESKDEYDYLVQQERNLIARLDVEIKNQEEKIEKHRMAIGGLKAVHKQRRQLEKHIRILENQLNLATMKFNTILTKNRKLREDINNLRIHKEIYAKLFNKLNAKLQHQKKIMKEIVQESVLAYDQRMEAESRIIAVRERSEKDIQLYNTEIKELMRVIDHEAKLKEFMLIKFRQLVKEDRAESKVGKKSPKEMEYEIYENAYNELKKLTGLDSLYALGSEFLITEEKNYALFNFVNELNRQMELKQEKILNLKNEILEFENRRQEKEQTMHASIKIVEDQLEQTTKQVNRFEKLGKRTSKTLEQLKSGIEVTFNKIKCDPTIIYQKLCGREGISNSNTMVYLGLIEKKTIDLLKIHMLMLQALEQQHETPPLSPSSSMSSLTSVNVLFAGADLINMMKPIKISSPVLIDESDDDMSNVADTEQLVPLSHKELWLMVQRDSAIASPTIPH